MTSQRPEGELTMRHSFGLRAALMALTVALVGLGLSSSARADSGTITFRVLKGGWFIGASGGSGTLFFHGRRYPLSIGGLSVGLVFGGSETYFQGTVTNIRSPYDVTGIYGAAGAGAAVVAGGQVIVLRNEKGAVLRLSGQQIGLQINADLSGLSVSVR
jgi:hypothetical protein